MRVFPFYYHYSLRSDIEVSDADKEWNKVRTHGI